MDMTRNQVFLVREASCIKNEVNTVFSPKHVKRIPSETTLKHKNTSREDYISSHMAMVPVLFMAQLFAVMPLYGFKTKRASSLRFVWLSPRMFHSFVIICAIFTLSLLSIVWLSQGSMTMGRLEPSIWFVSKCIMIISFTRLARKWPKLMRNWESVEKKLPVFNDPKQNQQFCTTIKWLTIVVAIIIMIEHSMAIAAGVYQGSLCENRTAIQGYFFHAYPQIYNMNYFDGGYIGFLAEFLNYYCTFHWTFMDIFIVATSICLSTRLAQFNAFLLQYKGIAMPVVFWAKQRHSFTLISNLVMQVDESITFITTFSVSNNLYFILIQLLNVFNPKETTIENVYFWFSLGFLLSRTLFVTIIAARLNEESKRPVAVLRAIPMDHFHTEAKRFLEQVVNTEIAFTGLGFFTINRRLVLGMAGTIVTYELVLIQFQVLMIETHKSVKC